MNQKRVCFIASVHQSPFNIRVFHKEAKSLKTAGYDLTLIVQHERDETVEGIRIIALPRPRNRFQRITLHSMRALIAALRQKALVYHIQSPELLLSAIVLKLLTGKRIVYDVHEDFPKDIQTKEWLPAGLRKVTARVFAGFERVACWFVDSVIAATESIARHFPASKTVVVTNYPFRTLAEQTVMRSSRSKDVYRLLYAGDLSEERGISGLVTAIGEIDSLNVRLVLIGRFTDPRFGIRIQAMSSYSRVEGHEWMPFEKIVDQYRKADAGIVVYLPRPNHVEAMPNKLFEYMAMELPVIASDFPLWKGIIEGNDCGITVNPANPREIAWAVSRLLTDGKMRLRMGQNGRRAVIKEYNWEREEAKLIDAYRRLTDPA